MFCFFSNMKKSTTDEQKEKPVSPHMQKIFPFPHRKHHSKHTGNRKEKEGKAKKKDLEGKITGNLHKIQLSECRFFIFSFSIFCPFLPLPFFPLSLQYLEARVMNYHISCGNEWGATTTMFVFKFVPPKWSWKLKTQKGSRLQRNAAKYAIKIYPHNREPKNQAQPKAMIHEKHTDMVKLVETL